MDHYLEGASFVKKKHAFVDHNREFEGGWKYHPKKAGCFHGGPTWRIIPFRKWLITMDDCKSPKDRVGLNPLQMTELHG